MPELVEIEKGFREKLQAFNPGSDMPSRIMSSQGNVTQHLIDNPPPVESLNKKAIAGKAALGAAGAYGLFRLVRHEAAAEARALKAARRKKMLVGSAAAGAGGLYAGQSVERRRRGQ